MKKLLIMLCITIALQASAQQLSDKQQIVALMHQQISDWNHGNINGFMEAYWKDDSLMFIGKSGITYGWQQTLNNYLKSYPDTKTMGQLQFDLLTIEVLSPTSAYVIGKWNLHREPAMRNVGGHFTLLFKKIKGKWCIVADHTS